MKLKNLKELEKVMHLCRANGIPEITIDGVTMRFDELKPTAQPVAEKAKLDDIVTDGFDSYTDEQIATWSSPGT